MNRACKPALQSMWAKSEATITSSLCIRPIVPPTFPQASFHHKHLIGVHLSEPHFELRGSAPPKSRTMKRKSCVYINEDIAVRLTAAADQLGVTRSGLVAAALHRFLDETEGHDAPSSVEHELAGMRRQLDRLDHDLKIVNETVAMHARYHLAVTPAFPEAAQRAACTIGAARFDEFAAQVGRRVRVGKPLIRETLDRLSATRPDLMGAEDPLALGNPSIRHDRMVHGAMNDRPSDLHENSARSAAAREDGSNGAFPGAASYRPHSTVQRRQT